MTHTAPRDRSTNPMLKHPLCPWPQFLRLSLLLASLHYAASLLHYTFPLSQSPGFWKDASDLYSWLFWNPFDNFDRDGRLQRLILLLGLPLLSLCFGSILALLFFCCRRLWTRIVSRPVSTPHPLTRRLFTTLAFLSLLLGLTTAAFWVHSYLSPRLTPLFSSPGVGTACILGSAQGRFLVHFYKTHLSFSSDPPGTWTAVRYNPRSETRLPGLTISTSHLFAQKRLSPNGPSPTPPSPNPPILYISDCFFRVAFWLPFILFALLPLLWLFHFLHHRHWRHASRLAQGLCPACGYDLRVSNNRCPECGEPFASPNVQSPTP